MIGMRHHRRQLRLRPAVVAVVALAGGMIASTGTSYAAATSVVGSAYGVSAPNITIFTGHQPPYGPRPSVKLPAAGSATVVKASDPAENVSYGPATFFQSGPVTVTTRGTPASGTVTSTAAISPATQPAGSCPGTQTSCIYNGPLTADAISSRCTASATGKTVVTTVTGGQLVSQQNPDGTPRQTIILPTHPTVNYTINGYLYPSATDKETFTYIFNQQRVNSDGSTTVTAVHEILHGPTAIGDVHIGQSVCGVS